MDVGTSRLNFLEEAGLEANTQYLESFHFDLNERSANELLPIVLAGNKRATAGSPLVLRRKAAKCPVLAAFRSLPTGTEIPAA